MDVMTGVFPARGLALIRRIETAETYGNSSIIVPETTRDRIAACQFTLVAIGNYAFCEDIEECPRRHTKKNEHRHELMVEDWVLVKFRSWGNTPDPDLYVVRQDDILARFREAQLAP